MGYGIKLCLGCRQLGHWDSSGRCETCKTAHKAKYNGDHREERARFARMLAAGVLLDCRRCGQPIDPDKPRSWQLGHGEGSEPEHRYCNEAGVTFHHVIPS